MVGSLRLEATAELTGRLKAAGLLLTDAELQEFLRLQKSRGRDLDRRLIAPILNPAEHALLAGTNALGMFSRPTIRIPLVAAFGYEVGYSLNSFLSVREHERERLARLCALFNVGISLFDRVCDRGEAALDKLGMVFNETMLQRLMREDGIQLSLCDSVAEQRPSELRALLALIAAFFKGLRTAAAGRRTDDCWSRLTQILIAAYRAELATTSGQAHAAPIHRLAESAHLKSTLPFEIMLAVAQLHGPGGAEGSEHPANSFARCIGVVFSLSDDLSDLSRDHQRQDANTILLDAQAALSSRAAPTTLSAALASALDAAVERLMDNLCAAMRLIESIGSARDRHRCRKMLIGYTRSWLGVDPARIGE